jgi:sarcosine oxidase, subunit alpha
MQAHCIYEAIANADKSQVQAAIICPYDENNNTPLIENSFTLECDGIAMCAGAAPAAALLYQAGTSMQYDTRHISLYPIVYPMVFLLQVK